jgi:hypothetical protein
VHCVIGVEVPGVMLSEWLHLWCMVCLFGTAAACARLRIGCHGSKAVHLAVSSGMLGSPWLGGLMSYGCACLQLMIADAPAAWLYSTAQVLAT